jgi:hypothetical protein
VCGTQVYGLSYFDEEGDIIPARDDGDYRAMIGLYEWMQSDPTTAGPITANLQLEEPRSSRNKLGLTVDIGGAAGPARAAEDDRPPSQMFGEQYDASSAVEGTGEILESDLLFGDVLGSGSGGTVYCTLHRPTQLMMAVKVIVHGLTLVVLRARTLAPLEHAHTHTLTLALAQWAPRDEQASTHAYRLTSCCARVLLPRWGVVRTGHSD